MTPEPQTRPASRVALRLGIAVAILHALPMTCLFIMGMVGGWQGSGDVLPLPLFIAMLINYPVVDLAFDAPGNGAVPLLFLSLWMWGVLLYAGIATALGACVDWALHLQSRSSAQSGPEP